MIINSSGQNNAANRTELIWENPSPDSSFGPQTIEFNVSQYTMLYVSITATYDDDGSTTIATFVITPDYTGSQLMRTYSGGSQVQRSATVVDNGIRFGNTTIIGGDSSDLNNRGVPYRIYGRR